MQTWVAEVASRLGPEPVTVVSPAHPALPREREAGGVRERRVAVPARVRAASALLPDRRSRRTNARRRAYGRAAAAALRGFDGAILVANRPDFVAPVRAAAPEARVAVRLDNVHLEDAQALRDADAVVACSAFVAGAVARVAGLEAVHVAHNGVDVERLRPAGAAERAAARAALGLGDGPVVLFAGRVVAEKGLHLLLDAVPAIRAARPDAQVLVVGSGAFGRPTATPYERSVAAAAAALGPAVRVAGFVPPRDMPAIWRSADLLCAPALWDEPFGLVYLEAMAAGVPPVGTRRGGIPEIVEHGATGWLLEPTPTVPELAAAVVRLLDEPELRARLGRAGRAVAESRFTWDAMAQALASRLL